MWSPELCELVEVWHLDPDKVPHSVGICPGAFCVQLLKIKTCFKFALFCSFKTPCIRRYQCHWSATRQLLPSSGSPGSTCRSLACSCRCFRHTWELDGFELIDDGVDNDDDDQIDNEEFTDKDVLVNSCRAPHPSISVVLLVGCAVFILVIVLLCVSFVVDCISLLGVESFDFLTLWIITCVDFQNPRQESLCPCTHSVWSDPGAHVSQTYILFMFLIFFPPPAPLCEGPQSHRLATQTCLKHPENIGFESLPKRIRALSSPCPLSTRILQAQN